MNCNNNLIFICYHFKTIKLVLRKRIQNNYILDFRVWMHLIKGLSLPSTLTFSVLQLFSLQIVEELIMDLFCSRTASKIGWLYRCTDAQVHLGLERPIVIRRQILSPLSILIGTFRSSQWRDLWCPSQYQPAHEGARSSRHLYMYVLRLRHNAGHVFSRWSAVSCLCSFCRNRLVNAPGQCLLH